MHTYPTRKQDKLFLIDKITLKSASYPTKLLIWAFHEIIIVKFSYLKMQFDSL